MSAQDVILGSRVAHVRELKTEIEKLKAENARLHDENESLNAHFAQALLAAAPRLEVSPEGGLKASAPGKPLQGEVPSPLAPPAGCPFHPRCPKATAECTTSVPEWRDVSPEHKIRCHLKERT